MAQNRLDWLVLHPAAAARGVSLAEEPGLDRGIQDHIGAKLRAMYDELRDQPVPDRFLELLGDLDRTAPSGEET